MPHSVGDRGFLSLTNTAGPDQRYEMGRVDRAPAATVGAMRKLIVQQWVTVDNIAAEEDGGLSFVSGEPFSETTNPWGDFPAATVTRDPAATIRELKEQSGKDVWLWGSLKLMHSLLDAGVVDELQMRVCPASRGKGTRIFEDWQDLKLVEATSFENGVVLLRYEIKR
jgi:riboflavin biosynthesis pyrimidine reductase